MKRILNFFTIFSVLVLCIKYYFENKISLELCGILLICSVVLAALDRPIWHLLKAGVSFFSFGLLIVSYVYNWNDVGSLLQPFLVMFVALIGIYIMVSDYSKNMMMKSITQLKEKQENLNESFGKYCCRKLTIFKTT